MFKLNVNIDHVATVRQARRGKEPDPVWAVVEAELGGADGITFHLREDRRHIQDRDVPLILEIAQVKTNMEMAATDEMIGLALGWKPRQVTLVPERREEITTEGGLDIVGQADRIAHAIKQLKEAGIVASLFIDPDEKQVEASHQVGADAVELHTGTYANAVSPHDIGEQWSALDTAGRQARSLGMVLHLGHGLNYTNTAPLLAIDEVEELNIGHGIISRAMFVGLQQAVSQMKKVIARGPVGPPAG